MPKVADHETGNDFLCSEPPPKRSGDKSPGDLPQMKASRPKVTTNASFPLHVVAETCIPNTRKNVITEGLQYNQPYFYELRMERAWLMLRAIQKEGQFMNFKTSSFVKEASQHFQSKRYSTHHTRGGGSNPSGGNFNHIPIIRRSLMVERDTNKLLPARVIPIFCSSRHGICLFDGLFCLKGCLYTTEEGRVFKKGSIQQYPKNKTPYVKRLRISVRVPTRSRFGNHLEEHYYPLPAPFFCFCFDHYSTQISNLRWNSSAV